MTYLYFFQIVLERALWIFAFPKLEECAADRHALGV